MEDRNLLNSILKGSKWKIRFARPSGRRRSAPHPATGLLRQMSGVGAILTDAHFPDGRTWKDVLHEIEAIPNPPPLIVADRLADEALWAEVLNLGGYDVLTKPFDEKEVLHAVMVACDFCRKRAASFDPRPVSQKVRWSAA